MFPRAQRLHDSKEILSVFRRGERVRSGEVTLYRLPAPSFRATVIVDKKVSKKAVVRNQVKRQIRALLRHEISTPSGWVVVRGFSGVERYSFAELTTHLRQCLRSRRNGR